MHRIRIVWRRCPLTTNKVHYLVFTFTWCVRVRQNHLNNSSSIRNSHNFGRIINESFVCYVLEVPYLRCTSQFAEIETGDEWSNKLFAKDLFLNVPLRIYYWEKQGAKIGEWGGKGGRRNEDLWTAEVLPLFACTIRSEDPAFYPFVGSTNNYQLSNYKEQKEHLKRNLLRYSPNLGHC